MSQDLKGLPPRRAAAGAIAETLSQGRTLDQTLPGQPDFKRLDGRDRAFARAIAAMTFRRLGQTDAALSAFLDKPLPDTAHRARAVLRSAAAQILFLDTPAHAAADAAVSLMDERKQTQRYAKLANAVLRRVAENAAQLREAAPVSANLPDWLRRSWAGAYGEAGLTAIAESWMGEPPLDLTLRQPDQAADWAETLEAAIRPDGGLRLARAPRDIAAMPGFDDGAWWVQDAAAALPARLLGDLTGKSALDLCAAPGGKTLQLAARGAEVTALDRSKARLKRLEENLARTGLSAAIVTADALAWTPPDSALFDALLLDAPCTATGTLRRSPEAAWIKRPEDAANLSALQAELLDRAAQWLKPGGALVYCVCSLQPEEGEAIARAAPAGLTPEPVDPADYGLPEQAATGDGFLRLRPDFWPETGGMDGFFAARFRRAS